MMCDETGRPLALVADDEAEWRMDPERALLDEMGYAVHQALDGAEARKKLRDEAYALVLLDMLMPDPEHLDEEEKETGLRVLRLLRSAQWDGATTRNVPVVVLSGVPRRDLPEDVDGLAVFVQKPSLDGELKVAIEEACAGNVRQRGSGGQH